MWSLEQHILTPKYYILRSLVPNVKHYFMTMEEDGNQFKIICQCCTVVVTCSGRSGELLYITFIRSIMSTLVIYPEDLVQ